MEIHELKTYPKYIRATAEGIKPFEVRRNDRNYNVGDVLLLREYDNGIYTGFNITREVTYILDEKPFVPDGYVVMGLKEMEG